MPYNFITAQAGGILSELKNVNDIYDAKNLGKLVGLAFLILLPTIFKSRLKKIANIEMEDSKASKKTKAS